MNFNNEEMFQQFLPQLMPLIRATFDAGVEQGFHLGRQVGWVEGVNAMMPAVSDGLRYGSPECGRAMQGYKNLGLGNDVSKDAGDDDDPAAEPVGVD
jgi:hypothetical protein